MCKHSWSKSGDFNRFVSYMRPIWSSKGVIKRLQYPHQGCCTSFSSIPIWYSWHCHGTHAPPICNPLFSSEPFSMVGMTISCFLLKKMWSHNLQSKIKTYIKSLRAMCNAIFVSTAPRCFTNTNICWCFRMVATFFTELKASGPVQRILTRRILSQVAAVAHPANSNNILGVFDNGFSPEHQIYIFFLWTVSIHDKVSRHMSGVTWYVIFISMNLPINLILILIFFQLSTSLHFSTCTYIPWILMTSGGALSRSLLLPELLLSLLQGNASSYVPQASIKFPSTHPFSLVRIGSTNWLLDN